MPDRLSLHAPVLVNTIGHCAGAIAFGILLYLLLLDWRRATSDRSLLPSVAACLAFLWNMGSLIGMATAPSGYPVADVIVAGSFSVLSLLPAVLLHISLRSRPVIGDSRGRHRATRRERQASGRCDGAVSVCHLIRALRIGARYQSVVR
jgi:heme A synthase